MINFINLLKLLSKIKENPKIANYELMHVNKNNEHYGSIFSWASEEMLKRKMGEVEEEPKKSHEAYKLNNRAWNFIM